MEQVVPQQLYKISLLNSQHVILILKYIYIYNYIAGSVAKLSLIIIFVVYNSCVHLIVRVLCIE